MVVSTYRKGGSECRKCGSQSPDSWLKGSRNTHRTKEILEQAYDNWFDLELNPKIQSIPIGDYLTDELNKAGIYYEIYYKDF